MSEAKESVRELQSALLREMSQVIVGQEVMLRGILTGLLTGGHILIEGLPGLAKTLSVSVLARAVSLKFQRIQFTPDLLPTDIMGTMIFNAGAQEFTPKKGPVFTNILLADEINRAPAKVQSALLEAMEEKQVTIGEVSYPLPDPFLVLATQNPIEQEGTYPLPEAQKDRFLFKVRVDYPSGEEEMEILNRMASSQKPEVRSVWSGSDLGGVREHINSIYVDEKIKKYMIDLILATRKPREYGLSELEDLIEVGVSPRATVGFPPACRVQAFFQGRNYVSADDVKTVAYPLLRHRLVLSYEAQAENMTEDKIIRSILKAVEVPGR